jgi:dTDP-4-amino-4,6-dideoxygalactose transaminase
MKVPFLDLRDRPRDLQRRDLDAMRRVLESGVSVLGPEVDAFEREWAHQIGCLEAVGVANGLDALEIGLQTLNLPNGSEVLVPAISAAATLLSVLRAGLTPVLVDVDPWTGLMSMDSAEQAVSSQTGALVLVHLYGRLQQPDVWVRFCGDHGIYLVEDCAQAHQASWNGQWAGSFGQLAAFSFYPTKNLGALGDAGALTTSDALIAEQAREIRNYGQKRRYEHHRTGQNSRLDEVQAAVLRTRLTSLDEETSRRRVVAEYYYDNIGNKFLQPLRRPDQPENHVHHLFVVRVSRNRADVKNELLARGIETDIHYPLPLHRQPAFGDVTCSPTGLPQAESFADVCLSLPCNPWLKDSQLERVVEVVNDLKLD